MYQFVIQGGPVMWPLLLCSLVAATVCIERWWWRLRQSRRLNHAGIDAVLQQAQAGNLGQAMAGCERLHDPAAPVLAAGLEQAQTDPQKAMADAAEDYLQQARRGLGILDTVVTVSPLLGILGTVLGIIHSFDVLDQAGIQQPQAVVGGIAAALVTTATGLVIAVAAVVPLNFFIGAVRSDARRLEKLATRLELAITRHQHNGGV